MAEIAVVETAVARSLNVKASRALLAVAAVETSVGASTDSTVEEITSGRAPLLETGSDSVAAESEGVPSALCVAIEVAALAELLSSAEFEAEISGLDVVPLIAEAVLKPLAALMMSAAFSAIP